MRPERFDESRDRRGSPGERRISRRRGASLSAVIVLTVLLVLPALALAQLSGKLDWRFLIGYPALLSLVTYGFYWHDKRCAETGRWRTPETTLHLAEILGGWPGAFLAQRDFRHKIAKPRYQVKFWAIVALHEFTALDFLRDWELSRALLALVTS